MEIVYLIGNGFDINLGLKTKFRQFYDYYLKQESPNSTVGTFKETLNENKDLEQWADLELILGKYAEHFSNDTVLDFRELLNDIQDNLAQYISLQEKKIEITDQEKSKLNKDLFYPEVYLTEREQANFLNYKNKFLSSTFSANIITFNYTYTFENLYDFDGKSKQIGNHSYSQNTYPNILKSVEHIHGTTTSNMILGINDISQLNNEELKKNIRAIRSIVKLEMNKNAGTLRDERSFALIKRADLICIFGMSLGATDKVWWNAINNRLLNSNALLLIFGVNKGTPKLRDFLSEDDKDEIRNKILSYSNLTDTQRNILFNQIFVKFNSNMFALLSPKERKVVA